MNKEACLSRHFPSITWMLLLLVFLDPMNGKAMRERGGGGQRDPAGYKGLFLTLEQGSASKDDPRLNHLVVVCGKQFKPPKIQALPYKRINNLEGVPDPPSQQNTHVPLLA